MRWSKLLAVSLLVVGLCGQALAAEAKAKPAKATAVAKWAPAVKPKPLSNNVTRGLAFLVKSQHKNGGWAQGEESRQMGKSLDRVKDKPNVGDTCVATLALIRAGSTPAKGPHAENIRRGLAFICGEIKASDEKSLFITSIRGTRLQMKLGTYIDTFLTAMLLAEVKDQMPDEEGNKSILVALDKTMDKIERNQRSDGTWDKRGWAPTLQQGMASKALNRVAQVTAGGKVSEKVRAKAETYARAQFDKKNGKFTSTGSAGVVLYSGAANLGAIQDSANTNASLRLAYEEKAKNGGTEAERKEARAVLARFKKNNEDLDAAKAAIVKKLEDPRFIKGFGSNGGEEFLSYMNIGESLVVTGDDKWKKWDESITLNLNRIQNKDGSWTGHHCITGRTFCTAAALLVLTVDRAPVPLAAKVKRR